MDAVSYRMIGFVDWLLLVYMWILIISALISWVSPDPRNPLVRFMRQVTEPVLAPIRNLLPPWKTGGLDFSPMIVVIGIQFVRSVVLPMLV